ncbi:hypothetical protein C2845_PM09G13820 [Panicum miliaceum]|uniref:Xyloglucan endo-transglycosylase C-terminal domain-containing protein n=1 Tax=Panicum miliaceum TaxID=4540 RepID=A0A3L6S1I1_PANMI|nr:hypothetical protein C2845_PM09G13820 [Panicum miliaceum]
MPLPRESAPSGSISRVCPLPSGSTADAPYYDDPAARWWNGGEYEALSDSQRAAYEGVRNNSMFYDYCTDELRFNNHVPLECSYN